MERYFTKIEGNCEWKTFGSSTMFTLYDCAKKCLSESKCKAFSYIDKSDSPCQRKRYLCSSKKIKLDKNVITYNRKSVKSKLRLLKRIKGQTKKISIKITKH